MILTRVRLLTFESLQTLASENTLGVVVVDYYHTTTLIHANNSYISMFVSETPPVENIPKNKVNIIPHLTLF